MKICFICSEYPPGPHGGLGSIVQILARRLVQRGHEVRVTGIFTDKFLAPDYEVDQGVQVWRLREPKHRFGWLTARFAMYRQISDWAKEGAIELVDAPDWESPYAGWPAIPVPLIVRLNGSATYFASELNRPIKKTTVFLEQRHMTRADFWCSASAYTGRQTVKLFHKENMPYSVLYNPAEFAQTDTFVQRASDRVVFTGTLTEKKGVVSLIRAWASVVKAVPSAELHLYGKDGRTTEGQSMQAYLEALLPTEIKGSVYFHGHIDRSTLLQVLRQASIGIFPSFIEAFAMAPLEAMANGCPTIGTTLGSGPEQIQHEKTGLLIDPKQPEQLSEAIVRLLRSPAYAQQLGEAGKAFVQSTFSTDVIIPQNEAFFQRCIDQFKG